MRLCIYTSTYRERDDNDDDDDDDSSSGDGAMGGEKQVCVPKLL